MFDALLFHVLVNHSTLRYFYCSKELTGDFHCDRGMIRCFEGEKWISRAIAKISVFVCLEYVCIDRILPDFSVSLRVN